MSPLRDLQKQKHLAEAASAAGTAKVKLIEKGFLSCSTYRVSAMASVLGSSRGSGGLSSQLRCKSKRRRRRRSKRKGKDLVVGAERLLLTLLSLARSSGLWALPASSSSPLGDDGMSVQGRALGSSDPFASGGVVGGRLLTAHAGQ